MCRAAGFRQVWTVVGPSPALAAGRDLGRYRLYVHALK
jgi:hypothetical protein